MAAWAACLATHSAQRPVQGTPRAVNPARSAARLFVLRGARGTPASTILPTLGCALALTAAVLLSARPPRRDTLGWAVLAAVGVGLLVLPHFATSDLPAPEGNGDHVNGSATASLAVWAMGLGGAAERCAAAEKNEASSQHLVK